MTYSLYLVPSLHDDWEATWYGLTDAEFRDGVYPEAIPEDVARHMATHHTLYYLGRPYWHLEALVRCADSKPAFYPHNPI